MASLPPQQRQRRTSPQEQEQQQRTNDNGDSSFDESHQPANQEHSSAPSNSFADAQPELLNLTAPEAQSPKASSPEQTTRTEAVEPRKCWICFSDETEDTPNSSVWRNPCPCALTAHESCLLDWVADIESPSSSRDTAAPAEIRCPQCKHEIYLARPRSYVVEAYSAVEKFGSHFLWPGILGGVGYTILLGCSHHGANSIRTVFGVEDAEAILAPVQQWTWLEHQALERLPTIAEPILRGWRGWRVEFGLPLIPVALVASRTTIADAVLPVLPIVFFATHRGTSDTLELGYWPPSAALAFVVLPYVRGIYDEVLERVWGEWERGWVKETRPQLGQEGDDGNDDGDFEDHDEDVIELGIEVRVVDGEEDEEDDRNVAQGQDERVAREVEEALRLNDEHQPEEIAGDEPRAQGDEQQQPEQQQQPQQQNQRRQGHNRELNLLVYVTRAADTILGALLFPSISAFSGELLRLALPNSWTVTPVSGTLRGAKPTGLLQTRWGRSLVGGCLFVVLKDAVRIYARWRMAVAFRHRSVRDYDKKAGTVK